jgi:hypothetical protein
MTIELATDHNVYVLGAGFSRARGLPLISDFLNHLRDSIGWLREQGRDDEADSAMQVLEFRRTAASAAYWTQLDLENIEELFSLASAAPGDIDVHISRAIAATLDFRLSTVQQRNALVWCPDALHQIQGGWLSPHSVENGTFSLSKYSLLLARLLGMFGDGAPRGRNTLITFNYDTLVEEALEELKLQYHYGFGKKSFDSHRTSVAKNIEGAIPVLKLHGSVNWGRKGQGRGRSFTAFGRYSDLRKDSASVEIVPPTWKKVFEGQLEYVWGEAVTALGSATRIIVIGFSMPETDMHFKYLMAAGLKDNISLRKICFVNPESAKLMERASDVLRPEYIEDGRIDFLKMRALEFVREDIHMNAIGRPAMTKFAVHDDGGA